jgi:hypothetical protein
MLRQYLLDGWPVVGYDREGLLPWSPYASQAGSVSATQSILDEEHDHTKKGETNMSTRRFVISTAIIVLAAATLVAVALTAIALTVHNRQAQGSNDGVALARAAMPREPDECEWGNGSGWFTPLDPQPRRHIPLHCLERHGHGVTLARAVVPAGSGGYVALGVIGGFKPNCPWFGRCQWR